MKHFKVLAWCLAGPFILGYVLLLIMLNMNDKVILTKEQAVALLGKRKDIHTFRSGTGILFGADWTRKGLLKAIQDTDLIEIGGEACKRMGHGLVVWTGNDPLFVEVDKDKIEALEKQLVK